MGVLSPQLGSIVPSSVQATLTSNYLNFANGGGKRLRTTISTRNL